MKLKNIGVEIFGVLLCFLFVYTGINKIYDWNRTKMAMTRQVFPDWIGEILLYVLPPAEIIVGIMLILPMTKKIGFKLSAFLLSVFTLYIIFIMLNFFGWVPCICGGVINSLSWGEHLVFNLIFLLMAVLGSRWSR